MDVELAALLERAAVDAFGVSATELIGASPSRSFGVLEIEDCPPQIPGEITSRLCFKLAKHLVDTKVVPAEKFGGPSKVAEQLLSLLVRDGASEWFTLELGGSGHINATPTPKLLANWTLCFVVEAPLSLLRSGSFICVPESNHEQLGLQPDHDQLLERLRARTDPDAVALYERCSATGIRRFAERAMVLGVLGDPELDARPYLSGLAGRQNVPWLLDRFREDAARYEETLRPAGGGLEGSPPVVLAPSFALLRTFRRSLLLADLHQRPERFFAHLLQIVRDFYRVYNQPQYRAPRDEQFSAGESAWLHAWTRAVSAVTDAGVALC